jgi:multidrug efflux system outer membrane protein
MDRSLLTVSITAALVSCVFTGCAVGPSYKRPDVTVPQSWRVEYPEAQQITNTIWWKQFSDTVLDQLIEKALHENRDVKVAASRIEQSIGILQTTEAAFYPQLNGQIGAGIGNSFQTGGAGAVAAPAGVGGATARGNKSTSFYQANLSAGWQLDLWGKLRRGTEAVKADLLSSKEAARGVMLTVVTSTANEYINLRSLDRQIDIAKKTAEKWKKNYELILLQYRQGYASELELKQAKSQYEQSQSTIPPLSIAVTQQENALSVLLGQNPGPIPRGRSIDSLSLPQIPSELPSSLLADRPDIREAEQNLISANARIGVARSQYFPSISLTGLLGIVSTDLAKLFTNPTSVWNASAPLMVPVFQGGAIRGQVKSARAIEQQALQNYLKAIQNAFRDVNDALVAQEKNREQLDNVKAQYETLAAVAAISRMQFQNGYLSYTDVLPAEISSFQSELSVVQTESHLIQSIINLYAVMGGGWVAEAGEIGSETKNE